MKQHAIIAAVLIALSLFLNSGEARAQSSAGAFELYAASATAKRCLRSSP